MATRDEIHQLIESLTDEERVSLLKELGLRWWHICELEWFMTPLKPPGFGAALPIEGSSPVDPLCNVVLMSFGAKVPIVKALRDVFRWDLARTVEVLKFLPQMIAIEVERPEAEGIAHRLIQAGGCVEVLDAP